MAGCSGNSLADSRATVGRTASALAHSNQPPTPLRCVSSWPEACSVSLPPCSPRPSLAVRCVFECVGSAPCFAVCPLRPLLIAKSRLRCPASPRPALPHTGAAPCCPAGPPAAPTAAAAAGRVVGRPAARHQRTWLHGQHSGRLGSSKGTGRGAAAAATAGGWRRQHSTAQQAVSRSSSRGEWSEGRGRPQQAGWCSSSERWRQQLGASSSSSKAGGRAGAGAAAAAAAAAAQLGGPQQQSLGALALFVTCTCCYCCCCWWRPSAAAATTAAGAAAVCSDGWCSEARGSRHCCRSRCCW